jgi:hypothetical protein
MSGRRVDRSDPGERPDISNDLAGAEAPRRLRPEVTLQPPPRPGVSPPSVESNAPAPGTSRSAARGWVILAVLIAAAVGVFLWLPGWIARRPHPDAATVTPPATAVPPEAATEPAAPATPEPEAAEPPVTSAPEPRSEPAAPRRVAPVPAPAAPADPVSAEWARAMSEGLAALDRGALDEAQAALARAEAARPGAPATADAVKRVEEARKAEGLNEHRARGEAAEAREDWKGAAAEYDAALKLDPRVAFALAGRARTAPRAALDETLEGYLRKPERLSAEAVAREAERTLARAEEVESPGPRLQQQRAALERLVKDARTSVGVSLVSDGATEVVILRVGTLGTFKKKDVTLRPGSYVVLGKRQGYRDTRKTLVVSPGARPAPLDVRCSEAL